MKDLIKDYIEEYEELANASMARSQRAKTAFNLIEILLESSGLEFCSHNVAFFGSQRYKKYLNPILNRPITQDEWNELSLDEIFDFENLTTFPFEV
jgi:hypothetical protein